MTPQQAINQLKRDGFSDEEIIEAVLPMVREKFWVVDKESDDGRFLSGSWYPLVQYESFPGHEDTIQSLLRFPGDVGQSLVWYVPARGGMESLPGMANKVLNVVRKIVKEE